MEVFLAVGWVQTESTWCSDGPIVPAVDCDERGAVGGMRSERETRRIRIIPVPMPLHPPQIADDLIWDRIRAASVGSLPKARSCHVMAGPHALIYVFYDVRITD